jgi:hypothetical protein
MIPFIWMGNAVLIYIFKWLKLRLKMNYFLTLAIGAGVKSGFLFLSALLLYKLGLVPVVFLTAMGVMQLTTAVFGGIAAYGFQAVKKRLA